MSDLVDNFRKLAAATAVAVAGAVAQAAPPTPADLGQAAGPDWAQQVLDEALEPVVRFDPSQRRLFEDEARVIVVNWHRQKGKDFTTAAKAVDHCLRTGQDWFIISITQRQADATFRKCRAFAKAFEHLLGIELGWAEGGYDVEQKGEGGSTFVFKARELILPGGGRVVSLPGRDPDTLAGLTGNVVFTEFGLFPNGGYDHWRVVFPLSTRGFQVVVISTPRGRNTKFYEVHQDDATYSVHTCDIERSVAEDGFALADNKGRPCTIGEFRKLYGDEAGWLREYLCQFTGDLSSLLKWAQIEEAAALSAGRPLTVLRFDGAVNFPALGAALAGVELDLKAAGARGEAGWDVARRGDLSSLALNLAIRNRPKHLRLLLLMQDVPFAEQRRAVELVMKTSRRNVGAGDSTGLGMSDNEALSTTFGDRWLSFSFAGAGKRELASGLATAFGDGGQTLPPLDGPHAYVAHDLYAVQKDDSGGNLKIDESSNPLLPESHCDIAYAVALAPRRRLADRREAPAPAPDEKARRHVTLPTFDPKASHVRQVQAELHQPGRDHHLSPRGRGGGRDD